MCPRSHNKTVGGSPTASYFSCFAKKSNQKKATPNPPPLRGSLRCSTGQAAAELALRAQTVLADIPWPACATRWRTRGVKSENQKQRQTQQRLRHRRSAVGSAHIFFLFFCARCARTACVLDLEFDLPSPCAPPRSIANERGFRRGLSEHVVRVPQPRLFVMGRGNPAGAVNRGRLLWLTFLGKTRKVISCRAAPGK